MPDPAVIATFDPRGIGLRIAFVWRQDRYGHELSLCCAGDKEPGGLLARSREGSPQDEWPESPAFQQLLVESRGADRQVALLVGMSGASHWSASVEPVAGMAALDFDVACRVRAAPPSLQSSYEELSGPSDVVSGMKLRRLVITATAPAVVVRSAAGWTVRAALDELRPPCTIRWRYRIALASPDEEA